MKSSTLSRMKITVRLNCWFGALLLLAYLDIAKASNSVQRFEAEDPNVRSRNCIFGNSHNGYSGSGYMDFQGTNSWIEWDADIPEIGMYEIEVRYTAANSRPADLLLNGGKVGTYSFGSTTNWDNWSTEALVVQLFEGSTTIRIIASNSFGPNIDSMSIRLVQQISVAESVIMQSNSYLNRGQYVPSPSGLYQFGLSNTGGLELMDSSSNILWQANIRGGHRCFMQEDGNLLVRDHNMVSLWSSHTSENPGAHLVLDDSGLLYVRLGQNRLWVATSPPQGQPPAALVPPPAAQRQSPAPALSPVPPSLPIEKTTVLAPGDYLSKGDFFFSSSGSYKVGLSNEGDLVLRDNRSNPVWSAGISNGHRCFMQTDGNLIVRDAQNAAKWNSATGNNDGARLVIDDGGQIAVMQGSTPLWIQGLPRGTYQTPDASKDLHFPIRGIFYYPWFPATWTVNGQRAHFEPVLGYYSSSDPAVVEEHIDMLEYAYVDLSIASWWGPGTNLDKARISLLMDTTIALGSSIKWTIYHEDEYHFDSSPDEIRRDLDYLKQWFAWHPAWAHIDRRPVIFVYNEGGCEVANRWMAASQGQWYVVLKLFRGFLDCPIQPDSWHQYGPAHAELHIEGHSYSISPGFWRADQSRPLLNRQSRQQWRSIVQNMVNSQEPWQLITTFNEAGEGTMVESARQWTSNSGYGFYLDGLHEFY